MKWTTLLLGLLVSAYEKPASVGFQNPAGLSAPRGYSYAVTVIGGTTKYIAGQVSLDKDGNLIGEGDVRAQLVQVYENLGIALKASGASFNDVVKMNTYIVNLHAEHLSLLREVRANYLNSVNPPANTLVGVTALAQPGYLVEIEATAIITNASK
jgi:enamine deaminase RidA (YjgF/YER057c/UK114 family)